MSSTEQIEWPTVVAGCGSPHGDDQVGWLVAERLARRANLPARVAVVHEPTTLLSVLPGCRRLYVIDACHTGRVAGAVTRWTWPDERIAVADCHSSHGIGVADVLTLAATFGHLPPAVEIVGIEAEDCRPGRGLSANVELAASEVEAGMLEMLLNSSPVEDPCDEQERASGNAPGTEFSA